MSSSQARPRVVEEPSRRLVAVEGLQVALHHGEPKLAADRAGQSGRGRCRPGHCRDGEEGVFVLLLEQEALLAHLRMSRPTCATV